MLSVLLQSFCLSSIPANWWSRPGGAISSIKKNIVKWECYTPNPKTRRLGDRLWTMLGVISAVSWSWSSVSWPGLLEWIVLIVICILDRHPLIWFAYVPHYLHPSPHSNKELVFLILCALHHIVWSQPNQHELSLCLIFSAHQVYRYHLVGHITQLKPRWTPEDTDDSPGSLGLEDHNLS